MARLAVWESSCSCNRQRGRHLFSMQIPHTIWTSHTCSLRLPPSSSSNTPHDLDITHVLITLTTIIIIIKYPTQSGHHTRAHYAYHHHHHHHQIPHTIWTSHTCSLRLPPSSSSSSSSSNNPHNLNITHVLITLTTIIVVAQRAFFDANTPHDLNITHVLIMLTTIIVVAQRAFLRTGMWKQLYRNCSRNLFNAKKVRVQFKHYTRRVNYWTFQINPFANWWVSWPYSASTSLDCLV